MSEHDPTERTHVYEQDVARVDVARAYLAVELERTFGRNLQSDDGTITDSLARLTDQQINRLLEAMSYSYRMNGVFHTITDQSYDWQDVNVPMDAVRLTAMNPRLNEVIFSDDINRNPEKFADYLNRYFADNPQDDPDGLDEFRPHGDTVPKSKVIVMDKNDGIDVIDGNHRVVVAAMLGAVSVRAYRGVSNGKDSRSMVGDSVFLTLRLRYESAETDADRKTIIEAAELLAQASTDGESAIQTYWIEHPQREDTVAAGVKLIGRLKKSI